MRNKIEWVDTTRNVVSWEQGKTREWYLARLTDAIERNDQREFDRLMAEYKGRYS